MTKILDTVFDKTIDGLSRSMDLTWKRNQAITSNITNAETPLYRSVDVNFANELQRAFGQKDQTLEKTDPKHLDLASNTSAHLVADYSGATKPDGNNVDIDIQMGRLAQNSGEYANAARLIKRQLSFIKNAIRTGQQ